MKMPCEIVQDLMPLLEEDLCSQKSRDEVMNHLKTCQNCQKLYQLSETPIASVPAAEKDEKDTVLKKGFQKIRRKWRISLVLAVLVVPFCILLWGQIGGVGFSFSNIGQVVKAHSFLSELKKGDYESAFQYIDIEAKKNNWLEREDDTGFTEEELTNVEEDAERVFLQSAEMLKESGGITGSRFLAVSGVNAGEALTELRLDEHYRTNTEVIFEVTVNNKRQIFYVEMSHKGVVGFSSEGKWRTDPLDYFAEWDEYLWEEYKGVYFDPDAGAYVPVQ